MAASRRSVVLWAGVLRRALYSARLWARRRFPIGRRPTSSRRALEAARRAAAGGAVVAGAEGSGREVLTERAADNQLKTLLNVPDIVEGAMPFTIYLTEQSTLSPRHREILILRDGVAVRHRSRSGRATRPGRASRD